MFEGNKEKSAFLVTAPISSGFFCGLNLIFVS